QEHCYKTPINANVGWKRRSRLPTQGIRHRISFNRKIFGASVSTKSKSAFVCNDCGAEYSKWQGQCSECGAWNTLSEVRLGPTPSNRSAKFEGYAGGA